MFFVKLKNLLPALKPKSSVSLLLSSTDIDECQPFMNSCHRDGECVNTEGSYSCRCRPGFQGDGYDCVCESLLYWISTSIRASFCKFCCMQWFASSPRIVSVDKLSAIQRSLDRVVLLDFHNYLCIASYV